MFEARSDGGKGRELDLGARGRDWPLVVLKGMLVALAAVAGVVALLAVIRANQLGLDSHAYWAASRREDPYALGPGFRDAYLYSPAFLTVLKGLTWMPWPAFFVLWTAASAIAFAWLLRPLPIHFAVPAFVLCIPEMLYGNIHALLAVMAVLGFKRPGLWAFALLTKVTIGAVGVVWFAARGEWRAVAEILGVTAAITAVSMALDFDLWVAWFELLLTGEDASSPTIRLFRILCVLLVVGLAARRDAQWVVPVALFVATPRFVFFIKDMSVLAGVARLLPQRLKRSRTRGMTSSP